MPMLVKPLYQRSEGRDEERWCLVFDTDAGRLFIEHEQTRGDMHGRGYSTEIDEIDVTKFLNERGPGHQELARLLRGMFEDQREPADAKARRSFAACP